MAVKTVYLGVEAITAEANRQIQATGKYFDALRAKNPVELKVRLDRAQAIAESKIVAAEMATTVRDTIKLEMDRSLSGGFITGLLSRGGFGGKGGGVLGLVGASGGALGTASLGGLGALGFPALAGIAAGALSILPALVAAGAGVAAFGALAIPTFTAVSGAISGVSAANTKFAEAAQNVDIAIKTSAADAKLYNEALAKMPPNLASAAKLLGDQSVTWQGLTTAQQNNIIALSQNKSALSSLLPAQRTALGQLLDSKKVWDQLSPAQQKVAIGWQNVSTAFQAMATKLAPTVLTIMSEALNAINKVLPSILPLAQAAGKALGGLFGALDKAVASKGFSDFVKQLTSLSGPAITAIGTGIGQIAAALGKLLLALASPTATRDIKVLLEIVAGAITGLADAFNFATPRWNNNIRSMTNFARTMLRIFDDAFRFLHESALATALGVVSAFAWIPGPIGAPFRRAAAAIRGEMDAMQGHIGAVAGEIVHIFGRLNGLAANLYVYTNFVNVGTPPTVGGIYPTPSGLPPNVSFIGTPPRTNVPPNLRRGVLGYAGGTAGAAPGWAWVGERGPELVRFGGGETVLPGYAAGAGAGGRNSQIDELIDAVDGVTAAVGALAGVTASTPAALGAAMAMGSRAAAYGALYP